jgi:acetyl esterase/lipase
LERAKESAAHAADSVKAELMNGETPYNSLIAFAKGGIKSAFSYEIDTFAHKKASIEMLKILWRLPEDPILSVLIGIVFPAVYHSLTVIIPRPVEEGGPIPCQFIMNRAFPFHIPSSAIGPGQSITEVNGTGDMNPTRIILNFHGGGFIAGSPKSHETYLREWVTSTDCLLISVDYKLAPDHRWPYQLNECAYVYNWITENNPWGINASSIILTGDSAGANLVFTTTVKIIQEKKRIPDGIWTAYPALDFSYVCSPSRVIFINDVLLPFHFLVVCLDSYLPKTGESHENPLISPIFASDEILQQFPQHLTIASAGLDPLLDDAIKMVKRFENLGLPIHHKIYELLPHGFMQFASVSIPEAYRAKNQSIVSIKEMFESIEAQGKENIL